MTTNKINMGINLPTYNEEEMESSFKLFHCVRCGIHPKAYSVSIAKGDESRRLIQFIHVLPEKIKIVEVIGEIMPDVEIIETLFCGNCGSAGTWTYIPEFMLETLGMLKPKKDEEAIEEKDKMTAESSEKIKGKKNEKKYIT